MRTKFKTEYVIAGIVVFITIVGFLILVPKGDMRKASGISSPTATLQVAPPSNDSSEVLGADNVVFPSPTPVILTPETPSTPEPLPFVNTLTGIAGTWVLESWYDYPPELVNNEDFSRARFVWFEEEIYEVEFWMKDTTLRGIALLGEAPFYGATLTLSMKDSRGGGLYYLNGWVTIDSEGTVMIIKTTQYGTLQFSRES